MQLRNTYDQKAVLAELRPLVLETEAAFAGLARATYPLLYHMQFENNARAYFPDTKLFDLDAALPFRSNILLSNGAIITNAIAQREISLRPAAFRRAKVISIGSSRADFEERSGSFGVSTDGTAFMSTPIYPVNPVGARAKAKFNARAENSDYRLRKQYAENYAGAAAVASLTAEGLEYGFGIQQDRFVFSHLYDAWLSSEISDAQTVSKHTAVFLGAEIISMAGQRPPTLSR
jgi:hypothetical protein